MKLIFDGEENLETSEINEKTKTLEIDVGAYLDSNSPQRINNNDLK